MSWSCDLKTGIFCWGILKKFKYDVTVVFSSKDYVNELHKDSDETKVYYFRGLLFLNEKKM